MSKDLSQIVSELFADPSEGKELSSQIQRLGDEIRKVMHSDETSFGKFHGLLASFKEVIPDETQRYQAALKALSTTSKLDTKEIMRSLKGQLNELKVVEKGLLPSLSGWSDGLKDMEARAQQLKDEIAEMRDKLTKLEKEQRTVQSGIDSREKDLKNAERTIKELFAGISAEIISVNRKIGELTGEPVEEEQAEEKASAKGKGSGKKKKGEEKSVEITIETAPMDPKYQRKCPMCGGSFNLHELENLWQCYTCGHEEPAAGVPPSSTGPASEPQPAAEPAEERPEPFVGSLADMVNESREPVQKKRCPGCGKTMFYYPGEKAWRCNSCGYERRI